MMASETLYLLNIANLALCFTLSNLRLEAILIIRTIRGTPGVNTPIIADILRFVPPVLTQSVGVIQVTQVTRVTQDLGDLDDLGVLGGASRSPKSSRSSWSI